MIKLELDCFLTFSSGEDYSSPFFLPVVHWLVKKQRSPGQRVDPQEAKYHFFPVSGSRASDRSLVSQP